MNHGSYHIMNHSTHNVNMNHFQCGTVLPGEPWMESHGVTVGVIQSYLLVNNIDYMIFYT